MHGARISVWFFTGVLLVIYGALILGYGIYEWVADAYPKGVQLTNLHAPVWWGGILLLLGVGYTVRFWPRKDAESGAAASQKTDVSPRH